MIGIASLGIQVRDLFYLLACAFQHDLSWFFDHFRHVYNAFWLSFPSTLLFPYCPLVLGHKNWDTLLSLWYVYVYVPMCMHAHMYACKCMCMCGCMCMSVHAFVYLCVHANMCAYLCACMCICMSVLRDGTVLMAEESRLCSILRNQTLSCDLLGLPNSYAQFVSQL